MQHVVNGKVFDDYQQALNYENSLKSKETDFENNLRSLIDNNVNVTKVDFNGEIIYFAVGAKEADIKLMTYAYVESCLGRRYSIKESSSCNKEPKVSANYTFIKMTPDEVETIKLTLSNYLNKYRNQRRSKVELCTESGSRVIFIDFLGSIVNNDDTGENNYRYVNCEADIIGEIIANVLGADSTFPFRGR